MPRFTLRPNYQVYTGNAATGFTPFSDIDQGNDVWIGVGFNTDNADLFVGPAGIGKNYSMPIGNLFTVIGSGTAGVGNGLFGPFNGLRGWGLYSTDPFDICIVISSERGSETVK